MKFVIAENCNQFKYYYPKAQHDVAYLHDVRQLRGLRNYELEYVGTWWNLDAKFLEEVGVVHRANQSPTG